MIQIDRANTVIVGLDLFTVTEQHQAGLIDAIVQEQIPLWTANAYFVSASVHRSLDGVRVFTYSQWNPQFDYRSLSLPAVFCEFLPPDSRLLDVVISRSISPDVKIKVGSALPDDKAAPVTHLAEFRMIPANQPEMIRWASAEVERAMQQSPGLLSVTFHRSLDGIRLFNYGQWENEQAVAAIFKQPGFGSDRPAWKGLARNEFHLYQVVHVQAK